MAFTVLRAHHEAYDLHRRIVGFDTFTGFPDVGDKDTTRSAIPGLFAVAREYPDHLPAALAVHERLEPLGHIPRASRLRAARSRRWPPRGVCA